MTVSVDKHPVDEHELSSRDYEAISDRVKNRVLDDLTRHYSTKTWVILVGLSGLASYTIIGLAIVGIVVAFVGK